MHEEDAYVQDVASDPTSNVCDRVDCDDGAREATDELPRQRNDQSGGCCLGRRDSSAIPAQHVATIAPFRQSAGAFAFVSSALIAWSVARIRA